MERQKDQGKDRMSRQKINGVREESYKQVQRRDDGQKFQTKGDEELEWKGRVKLKGRWGESQKRKQVRKRRRERD